MVLWSMWNVLGNILDTWLRMKWVIMGIWRGRCHNDNMLLRIFSHCSYRVNLQLFSSHCDSLYTCHLSWWRHQMETFSASLALCAGNSPVPVNSPHKGQWRGVLMFSLICVWINGWVNNRESGYLRRNRGHHDVIVMCVTITLLSRIV